MKELRGELDGTGRRFALVTSRFNERITERLTAGARACLIEHGVVDDDIISLSVPGAWELPPVVERCAREGVCDAVIALGCVIRGETPHFEYIAGEAAAGLMRVALASPVPVVFGVLTTDTVEQARARAGGEKTDKGREAALSALELAGLYRELDGLGA